MVDASEAEIGVGQTAQGRDSIVGRERASAYILE
jgi:hypothetical protein